jgi:iron complex outermembrane receptor protein
MGRTSLGPIAGSVRAAVVAALMAVVSVGVVPAQPGNAAPADSLVAGSDLDLGEDQEILDLDIDQLARVDVFVPAMDIEVTSLSKQESTVGRSPAAIYVITSEMIRRSGATCIPDLLRMVPGLEVGRVEANSWAITSRGFNAYFGNKLLVLIDGRSVYNAEFSGVYWDVQDLLLEDIERIEVIRGPGGTLWGANAVNGVINVITKKAKDTQGALLSYGGGSEDLALGGIRYGGSNGRGLYWRIYGKHFERGPGFDRDAQPADDWRIGRGGFRLDWELDRCNCNALTVQGDYYGGVVGHNSIDPDPTSPFSRTTVEDGDVSGANVLARWTHVHNDQSDWTLQLYFDQYRRDRWMIFTRVNTIDADFQHRFPLGPHHRIIWGAGYRQVADELLGDGFALSYSPQKRTRDLYSGFVQDEITLVDDRLYLTLGSKFEHNDFTGFEYQPSARLLWSPDRRHSAWAAISRAVRTPARIDHDARYTLPHKTDPFSFFPRLFGDADFRSEELVAYEIGYRAQVSSRFAWDLATFVNVYEDLESIQSGTAFAEGANMIVPMAFGNGMRGQTYGVELAGQWTVSDAWELSASYSFLQLQLQVAAGCEAGPVALYEGSSPHNQVRFQSSWDITRCWQFDLALRYVDNLPAVDVNSYITMDARLAWLPCDSFELSLVGQNLLDGHHLEFDPYWYSARPTEVQRAVLARATWRY